MKTIKITDPVIIEHVEAAAERDNRSFTNFVLRLLDKTRRFWEHPDWDKIEYRNVWFGSN